MELFVLDPKTRLVDLNKTWISTIKEFKDILTAKNKGNIKQAERDFTFLFNYCDYKSKFINFSKEERLKEALRNSDLGEDKSYADDIFIQAAIARYNTLQKAPSLKFLEELKEGLHTGIKVIKKIRERLEDQLVELDISKYELEEGEGEEGKSKVKKIDPVVKLTNALKSLMVIGREVPQSLDELKELEDKVKAQLADEQVLRGKATKGEREDKGSIQVKITESIFD
jgi:hypothetical protein